MPNTALPDLLLSLNLMAVTLCKGNIHLLTVIFHTELIGQEIYHINTGKFNYQYFYFVTIQEGKIKN